MIFDFKENVHYYFTKEKWDKEDREKEKKLQSWEDSQHTNVL